MYPLIHMEHMESTQMLSILEELEEHLGHTVYTCSTLAPELGPAASINNHLATANASAPPPYLQVLAMVDIGLVTQVVHTMGVVDRGPTSSTPPRSRNSHLCGEATLEAMTKDL
jgi:hypothetical protein